MTQVTPRIFTQINPYEGASLDPISLVNPEVQYSDTRALSDANINDRFALLNRKQSTQGLTQEEKDEFAGLTAELRNRDSGKANAEQSGIEALFKNGGGPGGGGGASAGGGFDAFKQSLDLNDYLNNTYKSVMDKIPQVYASTQQAGIKQLHNLYGDRRGQAIREQAAMGNFGSPSASAAVGRADDQEYGAISDYINQLAGQQAQSLIGSEMDIAGKRAANQQYLGGLGLQGAQLDLSNRALNANNRLSQVQLINNARQFGQNYGLEREKLAENNRREGMYEGNQQREIALAEELGRKQAQSEGGDDIFSILGGVGQLAGGFGGLVGGISTGNPLLAMQGVNSVAGGAKSLSDANSSSSRPHPNFGYQPQPYSLRQQMWTTPDPVRF